MIFFGLAFLSVSGCVNFSPMSDPSRFFTLMPLPQVEQSQGRGTGEINNMFLGIGPIRFPAYLDREQIVTRTAQNRLDISENDRWAEPLEENFTRVLSQNLGMHLGGARIIRYPGKPANALACQIDIEVLRFEPNTRQEVELLAAWPLIDPEHQSASCLERVPHSAADRENPWKLRSAALSEILGDLSREIADSILARFRPNDR